MRSRPSTDFTGPRSAADDANARARRKAAAARANSPYPRTPRQTDSPNCIGRRPITGLCATARSRQSARSFQGRRARQESRHAMHRHAGVGSNSADSYPVTVCAGSICVQSDPSSVWLFIPLGTSHRAAFEEISPIRSFGHQGQGVKPSPVILPIAKAMHPSSISGWPAPSVTRPMVGGGHIKGGSHVPTESRRPENQNRCPA